MHPNALVLVPKANVKREYFKALENHNSSEPIALQDVIAQLAFDAQGLIPVIAQDANTKAILMFAWMNQQSLEQTISTGRMTYWSRSRQQLWTKGETTGHFQQLNVCHLIVMEMRCFARLNKQVPHAIPLERLAFTCKSMLKNNKFG